MSYYYTTFAGVSLPTGAPQHELGPGELASPLLTLPGGGVYDPSGQEYVQPGARRIVVDGLLLAASTSALKTAYDSLRALAGQRGTLTRVSDAGASFTITARCQSISTRRDAVWDLRLPVSLTFDLLDPYWAGTQTSSNSAISDGVQITPTLTVGGNVATTDMVLTLTAGDAAITEFTMSCGPFTWAGRSGCYFNWTWTGTLAATKALVIDCGARSIKNDGADAYSGFALNGTHNIEPWVVNLANGLTVGFLTAGGGTGATIAWVYKAGWA